MNKQTVHQPQDRITLARPRAAGPRRPLVGRGAEIRSVGVWLAVFLALGWTMVRFNPDSSAETPSFPTFQRAAPAAVDPGAASPQSATSEQITGEESDSSLAVLMQAQGPALTVPAEVVAMLQQRQEDLARREKAVRTAEERFAILKADMELILSKVEAAEKRRLLLKAQEEKALAERSVVQNKHAAELRTQQYAQLTKMYESMPTEEAAARIEQMPDRKALEILRLLKGKTAGSILAQVKVDRAAKLTEQLLSNP